MADKKVWFITGAGRGLGLEITKAALAYGHKVVATGRNPEKVSKALGHHQNLIVVKLDITRPEEASAAVNTAIKEFGAVDVLVNNAGNFVAGYFEELQTEQIRQQLETLLFGPMSTARHASAEKRTHYHYFLNRWYYGWCVLQRLCCRKICC